MEEQNNNGQQEEAKRGFRKYLLYLVAIAFVAFQIFKSCGDDETDYEEETSYESSAETSKDYSWIVGTWACDMGAYGTVVLKFDGNGTSGDCTEVQYGSYKYGTYSVVDNELRYKLNSESVTTTIEIQSGHRLHAGEGYYYRKR